MKDELISVIIPVYNVANYLDKCIESIIAQTYYNLELILINDGSMDESGKICDGFAKKDQRIKVIHQKNQGIAAVRNKGIIEAKGDYVFWVDGDDYVANTIIEELYRKLVQNKADMSICSYVQGSDRNFCFDRKETANTEILDYVKGLEWIYKSNKFSFVMAASWAKLIKKSLYKGLHYPNGKIFEDIYMSHHLISKCSKIVYIDREMYYYYQWPESILGKKLYLSKLDYLGAFEDRIHFFKEKGLSELAETARIQYLHALMWEYSRAKDILHAKLMVSHIKREYRKYYKLGSVNIGIKHETKRYMLAFYVWPFGLDLAYKIRAKIWRK